MHTPKPRLCTTLIPILTVGLTAGLASAQVPSDKGAPKHPKEILTFQDPVGLGASTGGLPMPVVMHTNQGERPVPKVKDEWYETPWTPVDQVRSPLDPPPEELRDPGDDLLPPLDPRRGLDRGVRIGPILLVPLDAVPLDLPRLGDASGLDLVTDPSIGAAAPVPAPGVLPLLAAGALAARRRRRR